MSNELLSNPQYTPNALLDWVIKQLNLKNDAALSRALEVLPPVISKIRHHKLPIGPTLLIKIHDLLDVPVHELRVLMGVGAGN